MKEKLFHLIKEDEYYLLYHQGSKEFQIFQAKSRWAFRKGVTLFSEFIGAWSEKGEWGADWHIIGREYRHSIAVPWRDVKCNKKFFVLSSDEIIKHVVPLEL